MRHTDEREGGRERGDGEIPARSQCRNSRGIVRAYQAISIGYNTRPPTRPECLVASKLEEVLEKSLFASRWILAPIFLGLSLALIALGFKFFQEAWHVFSQLIDLDESTIVLKVLAMIDIVLVGSLIIMVMFSGYENFVSTIDAKGTDSLSWLGKLDAGTLKLKVAASIVAISSIHLLRKFMEAETIDNSKLMWYVIMHMAFVFSAVLLGVLDKMSFAKHREH
jgi:uncharacterized protein (TIGR00645 family)